MLCLRRRSPLRPSGGTPLVRRPGSVRPGSLACILARLRVPLHPLQLAFGNREAHTQRLAETAQRDLILKRPAAAGHRQPSLTTADHP